MQFDLTEDQQQLVETARRFATGEMETVAAELEREDRPLGREWRQRLGEMGFLGVNIGEAHGGAGLGNLEALAVVEQFARVSQAVAWPIFESVVGPVKTIEAFAGDELKRRLLPAVCRGEIMIAAAMSEPGAGTALTDLTTRGTRTDAGYVLSGSKRWCSGAGDAEGYLVFCRFDDVPGAKGIGAVFVERDTPGMTFGAREELMGFRGIASADITLDDVEVPAGHLVVRPGAFGDLMSHFNLERCGNAVMCLANGAAAFERSLAYVQERQQFGKPLCEFQAVQLRLADMWMKLEAARLLVHRAVHRGKELPSAGDSSVAKCFANEAMREVTASAMQIMGGYGYAREYGIEQRHRDGWGWGVAGGVIDIQKVNIAASLVGRRFDQRA